MECCQGMGHDVCLADNLQLPYRSDSFDAAISIAVIHHLSTEERRAAAVREILRILKRGGQALIYNWAMEQQGCPAPGKLSADDILIQEDGKGSHSRITSYRGSCKINLLVGLASS